MEQNAPKWNSSLLQGLGATSLTIPGENTGSKAKKFIAALSLAALAAMSSFAPTMAHADNANQGTVYLAETIVTPDELVDETPGASVQTSKQATSLDIASDNPYTIAHKIPDREKGFFDKADEFLNGDVISQKMAQQAMDNNPVINSPAFKVIEAITSPLDAVVNLATDKGSDANKVGLGAAKVAAVTMQYATVGPASLVMDGIDGVKSAVGAIREHNDEEHLKAQNGVDAARDRMAKIYVAERERMASEQSGSVMTGNASRVDVDKADTQGLDTSTDGIDVLFTVAPAQQSRHDRGSALSR